jgi:protein-arginine kinase activator protein McsA
MNDYYNSFTDDIKLLESGKSLFEMETELNEKLDKLLFDEKYEEAARLRDYMNNNKIKRIK